MTSRERAKSLCEGWWRFVSKSALLEDEINALRAEARAEALEEAVQACERDAQKWEQGYAAARGAKYCAEAIRALKEKR